MNKKFNAKKQLTLLGLMTALLLLMSLYAARLSEHPGRSPSRSTLSRSPCLHWPSDL